MMRRGLLAALLAIFGMSANAAGLMEFYSLALGHDPAYRAAMEERDAGLEERAIGRAALLPRLALQYQTGRNHSEVTQPTFLGPMTTDRSYRSYAATLSLQQPLFDYDAVSRYRYGVAQAQYAEKHFDGRTQEVAVRVAEAYLDALYTIDQIDWVRAQKRAYAEQMVLNQHRLRAGEGTRTDMLETQARYDLAQAQEIEAQDNLDAALRKLAAMVGRPVHAEELAPLAGEVAPRPLDPADFGAWRDLALSRNPELAALNHALDAARQRIEQARAGHLPKVALYATAGRQKSNSESTYDQKYVTNSVGVQVSIPLFEGGGASAALRQAVDNHERLRYENDAKLNETLNALRQQFNLHTSSTAKIRAYQLAVESARELTTAMKRSVAGGERVNADVLDAEQQYYDALRNLAQARYAYLLSALRLKFHAGTLTEADVQDVAAHFAQ